ncbi:hypothetical protein N1851_019857 [Merluccius polli]|uniref:Uncharacterized protein n=1 Tax=Merluccius polli TaxID=89951 RepID=A0AA47NZE2_MERPO|nr:hypothetical protein N1851_019857 [Merluccius polli]
MGKKSFKAAKSRSLVLRKGKVADRFRFTLGDTQIPSVSEKPVKSLGKLFTSDLKDTTASQVPITTVEGFERKVNRFLRRWLGLPQSLSSIALFGHNNNLHLPFSSLVKEFKVT